MDTISSDPLIGAALAGIEIPAAHAAVSRATLSIARQRRSGDSLRGIWQPFPRTPEVCYDKTAHYDRSCVTIPVRFRRQSIPGTEAIEHLPRLRHRPPGR